MMVRIASRRGGSGSGGTITFCIRNRNVLFASCLILFALAAFSIILDDSASLTSSGILEAIDAAVSSTGGGSHSVRGAASARGDGRKDEDTNADAPDAVHKVAGLSCRKHGGPPDEIAAEMVYWRDIPQDAAYVSPFKSYGPEKKYLTFEPDEGGFFSSFLYDM